MNKEKLEILLNKMYYDYVDREEAQKIIDYIKNLEQRIDKSIEINKQIKEFVYNEMVDRCIPGSTELYELVKEERKILKGGNDE